MIKHATIFLVITEIVQKSKEVKKINSLFVQDNWGGGYIGWV